jgi:hypothetical protein
MPSFRGGVPDRAFFASFAALTFVLCGKAFDLASSIKNLEPQRSQRKSEKAAKQ